MESNRLAFTIIVGSDDDVFMQILIDDFSHVLYMRSLGWTDGKFHLVPILGINALESIYLSNMTLGCNDLVSFSQILFDLGRL